MTGNPTLDKIILGLNGIVVAAATAVIIFSHTAIKRPPTDQALEFGNLIEGQINEYQKPPVVMDEIIVNLYSREARLRFLNTKMNLMFDVSYKVSDGLFKWLGLSLALLLLGLFLALLATNKNHKIPLSPEREAPVIEIV